MRISLKLSLLFLLPVVVVSVLALSASPALAAGAPVIGEPTAEKVTETTATIKATIRPEEAKTFVYVEYNGAFTAPVEVAAIESGNPVTEKTVSFPLTGLQPGTKYAYRVFASNAEGKVESPEAANPAAHFKTVTTPPPHGETPWWHLTTGTRPTALGPDRARDEVQQLTVSATDGQFVLESNGVPVAVAAFDASAEALKGDLEGIYGPGNVEVAEGAGDTAEVHSWMVTFVGELADRPVATIQAAPEYFKVFKLECSREAADQEEKEKEEAEDVFPNCRKTVSVTGRTPGRPDGEVVVTAANLGDADVNGGCDNVGAGNGKYTSEACEEEAVAPAKGEFEKHTVSIADRLPAGLRVVSIEGIAGEPPGHGGNRGPVKCPTSKELKEGASLACTFKGTLPPYDEIEILIGVVVEHEPAPGEANEANVAGGEAANASLRRPLTMSGAPAPFGVEDYELSNEKEGGAPDTQAGSHPFQQTTTLTLNQTLELSPKFGERPRPVELTKDLNFKWPSGLIGNPTPIPRCTSGQFITPGAAGESNQCAPNTAVGVVMITINEPSSAGVFTFTVPLFNLEPSAGEPARLGFLFLGVPVFIDPSVRSGGDYGVNVTVSNITQTAAFLKSEVVVWGVPGDPRHDNARGWGCLETAREVPKSAPCNALEVHRPPAFLSLPTSCPKSPVTGEPEPLLSTVEGDSWLNPGPLTELASYKMPALDGCDALPFEPEIKVTPDGQQASKPTGLDVDVHVPQEGQLNGTGLAESNIRGITVKLPAGVAINPSSGDGLEACSEGLVGFTGFGQLPTDPGVSHPLFSPYLPGSIAALAAGNEEPLEPGKNFCADASKVGEVAIKTPLLPNPVKGFVYLASQEANPFGSVLAMYIVAEDPVSGVLVKVPGKVQLCQGAGETIAGMTCEAVGQLVATIENSPQAAFEDAELHFFGGERAPLATPSHCGTYTTEAVYIPWSGTPPVRSTSSFQITTGPNNTPCPGAQLPFNPSLTGGATNVNAGAFSPFDATFSRSSGEQNMQSVEVHLPPGLSGILTGVELCPEPQANQGACGPNSLIGETTVSVGVGGDPFTVSGGKFYLTGPYNGTGKCTVGTSGCAPFGITFEVPAKAGPFDFAKTQRNHPACDCVLVRGKIEVDPLTAAITITSNPPGTPDSIPTQLEGIPLEIQHVNAITTRSDFQFNPTNCSKMAVTGTIHSSEGGADTISVPFQVTNCAALKFAPKFAVSTSGKTSKAKGASLSVHLTYPKAPFGSQANIARVKVDLPKLLPSRLTTLQKACTAKQFETNPAGCPSASIIGHAKAITPLIPVPLEGPAYFVSHGGEAFPSLIMVLQGYGVTVDLVGTTFISKAGITSSTFKTVPDAPVGSFELTLPEGKFSALAANGNLCKSQSKLKMPTEFVAQSGLKINESTKISVTGCPKHKAKHARKAGKHKQGKRGKK